MHRERSQAHPLPGICGVRLQDKQALEQKLRDIQNVLEVVQTQRNELRQQYRVGGSGPLPVRPFYSQPASQPAASVFLLLRQ